MFSLAQIAVRDQASLLLCEAGTVQHPHRQSNEKDFELSRKRVMERGTAKSVDYRSVHIDREPSLRSSARARLMAHKAQRAVRARETTCGMLTFC